MHDTHEADKAEIRKLDVEWGDAACAKNLDAVVAFYDPEGAVVWPGAPAAHKTAAIRAAWVDLLKTPGLSLKFTPERIDVAATADLAIDYGKVDFGHDTDKGHVQETAKYIVVWKKTHGKWKVLYDCYNMNAPDA